MPTVKEITLQPSEQNEQNGSLGSLGVERRKEGDKGLLRGLLHELRNPLSSILTAAELVNDGEEIDEETKVLLQVVCKESKRMSEILSDFAHYVKTPVPHPIVFDICEVVHAIMSDLEQEAYYTGQLNFELDIPESCMVCADQGMISNALRNVICNAIDALNNGGTLTLKFCEPDEEPGVAFIEITNTGERLTDEDVDHAFDPFYTTKSDATGLGLSISRAVVEASSGQVWLERKPSKNGSPALTRAVMKLPKATSC